MKVIDILYELHCRNASLLWQDGKLWVTPKSALDDTLRAAMREHRAELEAYVQEASKPLVEAAIGIFGGEIVERQEWDEEHLYSNLPNFCRTPGGVCRQFTEKQLNAHTATQLHDKGNGCGQCDLMKADLQIARLVAKREKREEKERRQDWRKDRFTVGTTHDEED